MVDNSASDPSSNRAHSSFVFEVFCSVLKRDDLLGRNAFVGMCLFACVCVYVRFVPMLINILCEAFPSKRTERLTNLDTYTHTHTDLD